MAEAMDLEQGPAEDGDPDAIPAPWTLLDMPAAWLQQLLEALDPAARLQLFMGWRAMRDLMLSQRPVLLRFSLPITPERAQGAQASLELACKLCSNIQLVWNGVSMHRLGSSATPAQSTTTVCTLLSGTMAALGHPLTPVTTVELTSLQLDALVPSWLTTTCPNMTRLTLDRCQWSILPVAEGQHSCSQPRELVLCDPPSVHLFRPQPWLPHLANLTGLRSLTISRNMTPQLLAQCAAAIGTQLTQLRFSAGAHPISLQGLPAQFPCLSELWVCSIGNIPSMMMLDDLAMEALLSIPMLRVVGCRGFNLKESYANRECNWTQISFEELDVDQFDRLPLRNIQSLQAHASTGCRIVASSGAVAATRVAAAVARCGGVQFGDTVAVDYNPQIGAYYADSARVVAIMPILSSCTRTTRLAFSQVTMTRDVLHAMKQHVTSPALTTVDFSSCSWPMDAWSVLLPSMPPGVTQVHVHDNRVTEEELMKACVHACRPVSLTVWMQGQGREIEEERVMIAMADAGHQHVTLSLH